MGRLSILLVAAVGFAVYAPSLSGAFLWDDINQIVDNPHITSWRYVPSAFREALGAASGVSYTFYRPVQTLTLIADHSVWKFDPVGYHLTNIVLHILAALLFYRLVGRLVSNAYTPLVAALLFVSHPVHTEAICYISGRADPLAAVFLLSAFLAWIESAFFLSFCFFILAILSKETALLFPVLVLFYHFVFKKLFPAKRTFVVFAVAAAAYILLRLTVLRGILVYEPGQGTFWDRLPGFLAAYGEYARLLLGIGPFHMGYGLRRFFFSDPAVLWGLVLLGAAFWGMKVAWKRNALFFFGMGWFLLNLLPVSNLYLVNAYMAEHWLYLPSMGVILAVSSVLSRRVFAALGIFLTILFSFATFRQCDYWKEPVSFYERTLEYEPDNWTVLANLGLLYTQKGVPGKAISLYEGALSRNPALGTVHNNLAVLYLQKGKGQKALYHADRARALGVCLHPDFVKKIEAERARQGLSVGAN